MTPKEIVEELDKFIIGQDRAKRAVAIALRNRWRRMKLPEDLREEITPKNILMIGPTGVGKTEIARRLANLAEAPFIKVEATKFTEVGYVGREVESIIRDLAEVAVKNLRESELENVQQEAEVIAEKNILDALLSQNSKEDGGSEASEETYAWLRESLRRGDLDDREFEMEFEFSPSVEIMGPPGLEEMTSTLQSFMSNINNTKTKTLHLTVKQAKKRMIDEVANSLLNEEEIRASALEKLEQTGIVFLDEIDKVAKRSEHGADVSREGVQRDLLPLIEGCTVSTRFGSVITDHVLFIASGAFHLSKPSDLIPEMQGRLPIRVELDGLTADDFTRILTEPKASLTEQYKALMSTDGIVLSFTNDAVRRVAEIAWEVNENTENIGARRLHTVMERLMDEISFNADASSQEYEITAEYVNSHLSELAKDHDLSRYIL